MDIIIIEKGIHLKSAIIGIIFLLLFFNIFSPIAMSANPEQRSRLITFTSYIDFEYDVSALNEPLVIDASVSIPIKIKYWTNIPDVFKKILFPFNNLILYGSILSPMQTIHLEVLDIPDWANIYISSPDILTDIPFEGDGPVEIETNLIISLRVEAPAESYKIDIKASCDSIKRLNGFSHQEAIEFTPQYRPGFSVTVSNRSVNTPPDKKTIIPIEVKNMANKLSRITPSIVDNLSDFSIKLNPPLLNLYIDETGTINVEVKPPSNFQGNRTVQVDFAIEQFPKRDGSAVGAYSIDIDLYYEPEYTEDDDLNLDVIFGIVFIIIIISFLIFGRYRGYW